MSVWPELRCLLDTGMPPETAERCRALLEAGDDRQAAALLRRWRGELLDRLHQCQKQLDCLDYFYRSLEK